MTGHPGRRRLPDRLPGEGPAPVAYLPGARPVGARHPAAAPLAGATDTGEPDGEATQAATLAIRSLARRDMTRWEMLEALRRRGIPDDRAHEEADRLERQGLLDDAALAATLVETRLARKGLGRSGMRRELQRRHVADEDIESALAGLDDDADRARALEVARARLPHIHDPEPAAVRRRLAAYLGRRGYGTEAIESALRALSHEAGDASDGGSGR